MAFGEQNRLAIGATSGVPILLVLKGAERNGRKSDLYWSFEYRFRNTCHLGSLSSVSAMDSNIRHRSYWRKLSLQLNL